jgi:hypothetical protein
VGGLLKRLRHHRLETLVPECALLLHVAANPFQILRAGSGFQPAAIGARPF